jgi:hypothetical protein
MGDIMARSKHSNLSGADRFERRAKRGHCKPADRRLSTRRQVVDAAIRGTL